MQVLGFAGLTKWLDGGRARLRLLFARDAAESRMSREFQFHIEMETEQLVRTKGLSAAEARRQALARFGGVEAHKEALRDGRGLAWLTPLSLDVKLGGRMLLKYPGLTLAGGLALALAIGIGASWHHLSRQILHPILPLPGGDRLVEIDMQDTRANVREQRLLHDFLGWRDKLTTIDDLGAYRPVARNLLLAGETADATTPAKPLVGAEITASAFRVARVPPMIGRVLLDADE